jgi:hypothetical protein
VRITWYSADCGAGAPEAGQLAVGLLPGRLRQLERVQLAPELVQLGALVLLAQLPLDRLHLLAQQHLALPLAQLLLHLLLDLLLCLVQGELPLHDQQQRAHPLLDGEGLQQLLLRLGRHLDVERDQVGEGARLLDAVHDLGEHLGGDAAAAPQLGGPLAQLAVQRQERRVLDVHRRLVLHLADVRGEPLLRRALVVERLRARLALDQELHAAGPLLHLRDADDGPHRVQVLRVHLVRFSFCATASMRRSPASAASTACSVPGRPAEIGTAVPGKTTVSRSGRTGSIVFSLIHLPFASGCGGRSARRLLSHPGRIFPAMHRIPRGGVDVPRKALCRKGFRANGAGTASTAGGGGSGCRFGA